MTNDQHLGSVAPAGGPWGSVAPALVGPKRTKRQRAAAEVITEDARCTPVLLRAVITGKARMPRAALEIAAPNGEVIGHVALVNTMEGFDPEQRFWLVGDPTPGSVVALVSEGRTQVILPGGRLRAGPAVAQEWSGIACRMLGWQRPETGLDESSAFHAVFAHERASVDGPAFARAVRRFRTAAVTIPMVFFAFCFPYLFVIPFALHSGTSASTLLAPVVIGATLMTIWSAQCRRELAAEAELIEPGASRWGKEIAFTQSYWASMRKPPEPWDAPLPNAAV